MRCIVEVASILCHNLKQILKLALTGVVDAQTIGLLDGYSCWHVVDLCPVIPRWKHLLERSTG